MKTRPRPINVAKLREAQDHVHAAIGAILNADAGMDLAHEVRVLYRIEDTIWQTATWGGVAKRGKPV